LINNNKPAGQFFLKRLAKHTNAIPPKTAKSHFFLKGGFMRSRMGCYLSLAIIAALFMLYGPGLAQEYKKHGRGGGPDLAIRTMKGLHALTHPGESSFAITYNNAVILNAYAGNTPEGQRREAYVHRNLNGRITGIYSKPEPMMYAAGSGYHMEKITVRGTGETSQPEPERASAQEYDKFVIGLIEKKYGPSHSPDGRNIFGLKTGPSELLKEGVKVSADDLIYEKGVKIFFDDRLLDKRLKRPLDSGLVSRLASLGGVMARSKSLAEANLAYRSFVNSEKADYFKKNKTAIEKKTVVLVSLGNLMRRLAGSKSGQASMHKMGGLTRVHGLVLVPETKDVVLVGSVKKGTPPVGLDNLCIALRHVWKEGGTPRISLDGDVTNPLAPQKVRVSGIPKNSRFAHIMLEADYLAKKLGLGDAGTGVNIPSLITIQKALERHPTGLSSSRLWLTPVQPREGDIQVSSQEDIVLFETGVHILSEKMHIVNSCYVGAGVIEAAHGEVCESLTKHYQQIADQNPVFAQLQGLFDLVLLSKLLYHLGVDWPVLGQAAGLPVPAWKTPDSYPAIVMDYYDKHKHRPMKLSGGVVVHNYLGLQHQLHYDTSTQTRLRMEAKRLSQGGKIAATIKNIRLVLVAPSGGNRYLHEAMKVLAAGNYARAENLLNKVIEDDPYHGEAYVQRSHARVNLKKMRGAQRDLDKAIELLPTERYLRVIRVVLMMQMGLKPENIKAEPPVRLEVAQMVYENAINAFNNGAQKEALGLLNTALKLDQKHAGAYSLRGWLSLMRGGYESAYDDASKAIGLDPASAQGYSVRGAAALGLGPSDDEYYEDAYDDFSMAIKLAPQVPEWWYNRASVMEVWGNRLERDTDLARGHQAAIERYTGLLKKYKDRPVLWIRRAGALRRAGQVQAAIRDYDSALALDPKMAAAYVQRARARHSLGDYAKAAVDAAKAVSLASRNAEAYAVRAAAFYKLGRPQAAMADCNKAIALEPKLAYAYHIRALLKLDMNRKKDAVRDWQKAIEYDPAQKGFYGQMIEGVD
jgi:tetratricopeptide (TPR) repeat protein